MARYKIKHFLVIKKTNIHTILLSSLFSFIIICICYSYLYFSRAYVLILLLIILLSVFRNPSSSSLVLSETGSLDRAKAALERRKKTQFSQDNDTGMTGRVEGTRVNPDHLIEELLKNTNLDQADDSAECA